MKIHVLRHIAVILIFIAAASCKKKMPDPTPSKIESFGVDTTKIELPPNRNNNCTGISMVAQCLSLISKSPKKCKQTVEDVRKIILSGECSTAAFCSQATQGSSSYEFASTEYIEAVARGISDQYIKCYTEEKNKDVLKKCEEISLDDIEEGTCLAVAGKGDEYEDPTEPGNTINHAFTVCRSQKSGGLFKSSTLYLLDPSCDPSLIKSVKISKGYLSYTCKYNGSQKEKRGKTFTRSFKITNLVSTCEYVNKIIAPTPKSAR